MISPKRMGKLALLDLRFTRRSPKLIEMFQAYRAGEYEALMTLGLSEILERSKFELSKDQSEDLQEEICFRVYVAFQKWKRHAPGSPRASKLHAAVDRSIKEQNDEHPDVVKTIRCQKACSACCHWPVDVTDDEADLLSEKIMEAHYRHGDELADIDRVKLHASVGKDGFFALSHEERRCPFLGPDSLCRVYDDRPANCRKFYVTSDPALCADQTKPKLTPVLYGRAEELLSGAINLCQGGRFMSTALLDRLPHESRSMSSPTCEPSSEAAALPASPATADSTCRS